MGKGRSVILGIISFILITTIPVLIMGFSATQFLYQDTYEKAFEESGVYSIASSLFQQSLGTNIALPDNFIKTGIRNLMSSLLIYVRGESETLDLSMQVDEEMIKYLILQKISSIPTCPSGIVPQNIQMPECFPQGYNKAQFMDAAMRSIDLPDSIDITSFMPQLTEITNKVRGYVQILYNWLYALLVVSVVLLLIMVALTIRSPKSMLKWIGTTLLISGITVLALSFVLTNIVISAVGTQAGPIMPVISSLLDTFSGSMKIYSGIIAAIGALMYAASRFKKEKKKK